MKRGQGVTHLLWSPLHHLFPTDKTVQKEIRTNEFVDRPIYARPWLSPLTPTGSLGASFGAYPAWIIGIRSKKERRRMLG
jgi:hypothetical protein